MITSKNSIINQMYTDFAQQQKKKYCFVCVDKGGFEEVVKYLITSPELLCKLTVAVIEETNEIKTKV